MFEIVAHEHGAEVVGREDPAHLETADLQETGIRPEMFADVTQVGGPAFAGLDVADEVTAVRGDVQHGRVGIDEALKVLADLSPDPVLRRGVIRAETAFVEPVEIAARRGVG